MIVLAIIAGLLVGYLLAGLAFGVYDAVQIHRNNKIRKEVGLVLQPVRVRIR